MVKRDEPNPHRTTSPLGRLRNRIGYTQRDAASLFLSELYTENPDKAVRRIVHYEKDGGKFGEYRREKIQYMFWLIEQAAVIGITEIPDKAVLFPEVYGEQASNKKGAALTTPTR